VIVDFGLILYCIVAGGLYILLVGLLWSFLERIVPTFTDFPQELVEKKTFSWYFSNFIVEFIFFVLMPSVIYGWFYSVLPISGVRGGVAVGLYLFFFGMIPLSMLILFRVRVPAVYILYQLAGLFFKVVGAAAIIGYLYNL